MRYKLIKRNGGYDTILKWEKPSNYKVEHLQIIGFLALVIIGIFLLAPMTQAETSHCLKTSTNKTICQK